ncbi:MAG: recombinase family protein [Xenococcaceae cyanobacterium]
MSIVIESSNQLTTLSSLDFLGKVAYARVSTDQSHQYTSIERQVETYERYNPDIILVERESATHTDRPLYQFLIRNITIGKVSEVITSRSDRLNRDQTEMRFFYTLCTELGVAWTFTDEPELNSNSPWAIELRSQKAFESQQESERMGRRISRSYVFAEEKGIPISRNIPLGYRRGKDKKFELDNLLDDRSNLIGFYNSNPVAIVDLARILIDLYLEHQAATKALKLWKEVLRSVIDKTELGETKIERYLKFASNSVIEWSINPILRGHTAYGIHKKVFYGEKLDRKRYKRLKPHEWRINYNTHPDQALITDFEWRAIEKIIKTNENIGHRIAQARIAPGEPQSLSSFLRCEKCQLAYSRTSTYEKGKRYYYYYCNGRSKFSCKSKGISESQLRKGILEKITAQANGLIDLLLKSSEGQTPSVSSERLELLKTEAEEALKKYNLTNLPEYLNLHQQLNYQVKNIESNLQKELEQVQDKTQLLKAFSNPNYWNELDLIDLHRYLKAIIRICWISGKEIVSLELDF